MDILLSALKNLKLYPMLKVIFGSLDIFFPVVVTLFRNQRVNVVGKGKWIVLTCLFNG